MGLIILLFFDKRFITEDNVKECPFIEDNRRQLKINEIQTRWKGAEEQQQAAIAY